MPYTLIITIVSSEVRKTTTTFDSIEAIHDYLTTAVEIWNTHWEGWSESDVVPVPPGLATLSRIGTQPTLIMSLTYADGFSVSITASKSP